MRTRLPLGVALAALVVAVLGPIPPGRAAVAKAVLLAKRAYLADIPPMRSAFTAS